MDRPLATPRSALRKDPRGWQIEDDKVAERALQSLEVLGLIFAEVILKRLSHAHLDPGDTDLDLALRALGHVGGSVAMSRLSWMTGIDEAGNLRRDQANEAEAEAVGLQMRAVLNWLFEWDLANPNDPPKLRKPSAPPPSVRLALNELWASVMYLNRRASGQGTSGPGGRRRMVNTTTRKGSENGR